MNRLGGILVECPPRVREVAGLIPGRAIPTTLTMIVMTALLGAQGCRVGITSDWLVLYKWSSSTGNLPWELRDITENLLKAT